MTDRTNEQSGSGYDPERLDDLDELDEPDDEEFDDGQGEDD